MENNSEYMIRVATEGKLRPLPPGLEKDVLVDPNLARIVDVTPTGNYVVNSLDLEKYLSSRTSNN